MSVFSNPKSAAADAAAAYVAAVLDLLGDRDPMTVLRSSAARLRDALQGVPVDVLRRPEKPGKWSAVEILQHLADSELVWSHRLRLVAAEERPALTGYDQDAWAAALRYRDADPGDALQQFALLRRLNLAVLDGLPPGGLERVGLHSERGEESLAHMVRLYAGHDLVHLRQMDRVLASVA
jgi:uncharacterized damage-inducible protein DinB